MMKIIFILEIIFMLFLCVSCVDPDLFPPVSTKWVAEDENIEFWVSESGDQIGSMIVNNQKIDFFIECDYSFTMRIFPIEYFYYENIGGSDYPPIEKWTYTVQNGERIVTVNETTYFDVGQEIVFIMVEENIKESDIPYPEKPESLPETPEYDFPFADR